MNQRFEVSYHTEFLKKNKVIDFGRQPFWNCPIPENDGKPTISELGGDSNNRPQTQKLNQANINRADAAKKPQTTTRSVPTPKPVAKRDAWEIPPIQCNGEFRNF